MPPSGGSRASARAPLAFAAAGAGAAALALAGCGGGSPATAGEPEKRFDVKVVAASFPAKQAVAKPERMNLTVQNTGEARIGNLAVTVDSFNYTSNYAGLAANKRPVWAIEQGPGKPANPPVQTQEVSVPGGGQTSYVNTWSLGPLAPHATTTLTWRVVPVKSGPYTVRYVVTAGLGGKATASLASGGPAAGRFAVEIAPAPPLTHVDPKTGKLVSGPYLGTP